MQKSLSLPLMMSLSILALLVGCPTVDDECDTCNDGGTAEGDGPPYEVTVDSHLRNCTAVGPTTCMLLSDTPDSAPRLHYGNVIGFDYDWCSTHTLRVHDEPAPQLADGPIVNIVLDEVIASESADGETFSMTLFAGWQREISDAFVPYHCAEGDEALCANLHQALGESVNADNEVNDTSVEAQFICEGANASPRLVSFE